MKRIEVTDAITNAQNEGKPCPHCGSRFGHYGHCPSINAHTAEYARALQVGLSEPDAIALHGLGVRWN